MPLVRLSYAVAVNTDHIQSVKHMPGYEPPPDTPTEKGDPRPRKECLYIKLRDGAYERIVLEPFRSLNPNDIGQAFPHPEGHRAVHLTYLYHRLGIPL